MPVSRSALGKELRDGLARYLRDSAAMPSKEFEAKYPTPPTPAQAREKRRQLAKEITDNGGNPVEVWTSGYRGMGATIPSYLGTLDAKSFDDAVAALDPNGAWLAREGPFHATEEAAWAAHDAYWARLGHYHPNDYRRP